MNLPIAINKKTSLSQSIRILFTIIALLFSISFSQAQVRIKMKKENGVYTTPCKVNGLQLRFIFDTGASNVCISLSEALFMLKNGYLQEDDLFGSSYSQIANGDIIENTKVIIRELEIGGLKIYNIEAVIIHELNAPLLLGQSAIEKLGAIKIEYDELIIINQEIPSSKKACVKSIELRRKANEYYFDDLYYLSAKTYQEAYDICNKSLDCFDIYLMGDAYWRIEDHLLAIKYLELSSKCITDNNTLYFIYLYLSHSYRILNKYDNAILCAQKAISYATANIDISSAYDFLGWIYTDKSEFEKAIKYYKKSADYYLAHLDTSKNDVMNGKVENNVLGECYWNISVTYKDINKNSESDSYAIKSALCGFKHAIDYCNKYDINYKLFLE